ncbi:HNH endonuclease [Paraburkholderia aspalathi]|uniref:HNH endonuclease n=1 Tax=Paraburkholderia aspalathi TaxID=1324617 RepID=UPI0038BBBD9F
MSSAALTAEALRGLLYYSVVTGRFYRLKDSICAKGRVRAKAGDVAGGVNKQGYWVISVDGKTYQAHRIAWLYVTGEWPVNIIDHADTNRSYNAWLNLREADSSQNQSNRTRQRNNTSGVKGVCWCSTNHKWVVQLMVSGKRKHVGYFSGIDSARLAIEAARIKHHGEFSRHN